MRSKIKSISSLAISAALIALVPQSVSSEITQSAEITQSVELRGTGIFNIISGGERIGSLSLTCRNSFFGAGGPEAIAIISTPTLSAREESMTSGTAIFESVSSSGVALIPARRSSVFGPATLEHQAFLPSGTERIGMQSHSFITTKTIGGEDITTRYSFGRTPGGPNCPR